VLIRVHATIHIAGLMPKIWIYFRKIIDTKGRLGNGEQVWPVAS